MATAQQIADGVAKGIDVLAKIGAVEADVMPYAMFFAGFVPGLASALSVVAIAQPWINKALAAAPAVRAAVEAGAPIADALIAHGPDVLQNVKQAIAIFKNADPTVEGSDHTAADVSDDEALHAAVPLVLGRAWTREEEQRWWDKAQGTLG